MSTMVDGGDEGAVNKPLVSSNARIEEASALHPGVATHCYVQAFNHVPY
jgi:hypothetical protein